MIHIILESPSLLSQNTTVEKKEEGKIIFSTRGNTSLSVSKHGGEEEGVRWQSSTTFPLFPQVGFIQFKYAEKQGEVCWRWVPGREAGGIMLRKESL